MKRHFTLLSVFVLVAFQVAAQQVDTLYIYEPTVEYDTVFVHDTLWIHDTLHLQNQGVRETKSTKLRCAPNRIGTVTNY